jgi:hypothetical protein
MTELKNRIDFVYLFDVKTATLMETLMQEICHE